MTTIKIRVKKPNSKRATMIEIDADVFGPIAVHPAFNRTGYDITHIKTGYSITTWRFVYRRGAIALVKKLAKRPELFEHLSTTDASKNIEAAAYCKKCLESTPSAMRRYRD